MKNKKLQLSIKDFSFLNEVDIPFVQGRFRNKIASHEELNFVKVAKKKDNEESSEQLCFPDDFNLKNEMMAYPDFLYIKALAIIADESNDNGDFFSKDELKSSFHTFVDCPLFANHKNDDIEEARGSIVYAEWDEENNGVMIIGRVDTEAYPKLARGITEGYISGVSMGAINGDSMIRMNSGSDKPIRDVIEGDEVVSAYGNSRTVLKTHSAILNKRMHKFELTTYHKSPLFTCDHPILTISKKNIDENKKRSRSVAKKNYHTRKIDSAVDFVGQDGWRYESYAPEFKEAESIKCGDYFLIPSKYDLDNGMANKDLFYLYGAYLGCGNIDLNKNGEPHTVTFTVNKKELRLQDKIGRASARIIGKKASHLESSDHNATKLSVHDEPTAGKIIDLFGTGDHEKRISLSSISESDIISLLSGYIDVDGCATYAKKGNCINEIQISSCNQSLLEDVQSLLILIDVTSEVSESENNIAEYTLSIGYDHIYKFMAESIKLKDVKCENPSIMTGTTFITDAYGERYMACPVKSNQTVSYDKKVYDISVKGDESYVADGVAIHNCTVEKSTCSICENVASNDKEYCTHIREHKTRELNGKKVYEINHGIKFIELSFVVDPACEICYIQEVFDIEDIQKKVAGITKTLKVAAFEKKNGKEEIDKLSQAESLLKEVAKTMLDQSKYLQLEYVSDLVDALAKLQETRDELVDMGYEQVPSGAQSESPTPATSVAGGIETPAEKGDFLAQPNTNYEGVAEKPAGEVGTVTMPGAFASKVRKKLKKQGFKEQVKNKLKNNWE